MWYVHYLSKIYLSNFTILHKILRGAQIIRINYTFTVTFWRLIKQGYKCQEASYIGRSASVSDCKDTCKARGSKILSFYEVTRGSYSQCDCCPENTGLMATSGEVTGGEVYQLKGNISL